MLSDYPIKVPTDTVLALQKAVTLDLHQIIQWVIMIYNLTEQYIIVKEIDGCNNLDACILPEIIQCPLQFVLEA